MTTRKASTFFLACVVLFTSASATEDLQFSLPSCPPSHVISPCTCYLEDVALIQCSDIYEQEVLTRVLEESSDYKYRGFDLNSSSILYIPASIFDVKNLTKIYIKHSTMISLFDPKPSPQNDLISLTLFHVMLSRGVEWELFSEFRNLTTLMFLNTSVHKIDHSFMTHAPKGIELLAFVNCSVSKVDDHAFSSFVNLTEIHIEFGSIKELKRSMFPTPSKLNYFDFKGHKIQHLPDDIFSDMPHLTRVLLSENLLTMFSENVFRTIYPKLQFIEMEGNPIVCRCYIKWITKFAVPYKWFKINGDCSGPTELEGRSLQSLEMSDFAHCDE